MSTTAGFEDGNKSDEDYELSLSAKKDLLEKYRIGGTLYDRCTKRHRAECDNCGATTHDSKACMERHGKDLAWRYFVASYEARANILKQQRLLTLESVKKKENVGNGASDAKDDDDQARVDDAKQMAYAYLDDLEDDKLRSLWYKAKKTL